MNKDILIIANYCRDFSETDNGRFMYLAKQLCEKYSVEIVTSSFDHGTKQTKPSINHELPFKVTYLFEPGYKKNISLKRLISHRRWGREVLKYIKSRHKPDLVYVSIPSLSAPFFAANFCSKNNIPFVIDIQDLWPEAFQMAFNVPLLSKLIFSPFTIKANQIYKKADAICAVSKTYLERALKVNEKSNKAEVVFLGTELSRFDYFASQTPIIAKTKGDIWIGYCGTLGASYDLKCAIDALDMVNDERIVLIVMGSGPRKEEFEKYAQEKGIRHIFVGRLSYDKMCSLLCSCDMTVNPITHNAAQSIINKHADYAASGLPVLSTQENQEYKELIEEYEMGINCSNSDAKSLADAINKLIEDESLRKKMGTGARKCAEKCFDRKTTYKKIEKMIDSLLLS